MQERQTPDYNGPDDEKHKPLDKTPTERLIEQAIKIGDSDPLKEVCVRALLSTGLRNDELVHSKAKYINQEYSDEHGAVTWYVRIPEYEECTGGSSDGGQGNSDGANLHNTNSPCAICTDRSVDDKNWLSETQKANPGFSPKNKNSAERYQWLLPGREDVARKWKSICEANGGQFPVGHDAVNRRIRDVAWEAGLDDVRSVNPENGKLNITAHALRHTYGCKLGAEPDFNPTQVMSYMRHGSLDMALWYSNQWGERRREAMSNFEDKFSE